MKANVTLKLDATLLREARILAAEEGASTGLLAARLEEIGANVRLMSARESARWLGYARALICNGRLPASRRTS